MRIGGMLRFFVGQPLLEEKAHTKAQLMFLRLGVFNTRQRIGIMIFVSFLEHRVIVMADEGFSAVIPQEKWDGIVCEMTEKLKQNQKVEAIIGAIERCTELIEESSITILPTEVNEIPDELRIVEE
jgi:putative membrane protein